MTEGSVSIEELIARPNFTDALSVATARFASHPMWKRLEGTPWQNDAPAIAAELILAALTAAKLNADGALKASVPEDVAALVRSIGRAEWGSTPEHDADGHGAHVRDSVIATAEHFEQSGPQKMHGLYIEGTEVVICHTGTGPNSPQVARAMTGAWNYLLDAVAAKGTQS